MHARGAQKGGRRTEIRWPGRRNGGILVVFKISFLTSASHSGTLTRGPKAPSGNDWNCVSILSSWRVATNLVTRPPLLCYFLDGAESQKLCSPES